MSVYKEKNKKTGAEFYRADVTYTFPDGTVKRVKRTSPIQTLRGAEQFERDIRIALANGTWGKRRPAEAKTLEAFREDYFARHVAGLKASTRAGHKAIWDMHLVPVLGRCRLDQFGQDQLARLSAELREKGLGPKTQNNVLSCLRKALETAADWDLIQRSAVPRFKWAKVPEQKFDFFTFEEADALAAASEGDGIWAAMVPFALNTGLRLGELRALRWSDVDLKERRVDVSRSAWQATEAGTKSGKARSIPLNSAAMAALRLLTGKHFANAYVFTSDGKLLTKEQCKWPLWRACDRANLSRRAGWHACRHAFASHLVMRGVPLKTVQELLGHATIEMTMRYAHLAPGHLRSAVEAIERPSGAHSSHVNANSGGFTDGKMVEAPGVEPRTVKPRKRS